MTTNTEDSENVAHLPSRPLAHKCPQSGAAAGLPCRLDSGRKSKTFHVDRKLVAIFATLASAPASSGR